MSGAVFQWKVSFAAFARSQLMLEDFTIRQPSPVFSACLSTLVVTFKLIDRLLDQCLFDRSESCVFSTNTLIFIICLRVPRINGQTFLRKM